MKKLKDFTLAEKLLLLKDYFIDSFWLSVGYMVVWFRWWQEERQEAKEYYGDTQNAFESYLGKYQWWVEDNREAFHLVVYERALRFAERRVGRKLVFACLKHWQQSYRLDRQMT